MLLPYQKEDVEKACGEWRDRSVYFGHAMGLGKCCMAIESWKRLKAKKILVVCPASVRSVWRGEIEKWCSHSPKVQSITKTSATLNGSQVVVVSYDLAATRSIGKQLLRRWDVIVFDECHALGNPTSKRTKMCLGSLYPKAKKCLFLSGSIQRDKIINVWPVFRTLCPEKIPPYQKFISNYVNTKETRYGIKFLGGKNLDKLGKIARENFLIRRRKKDVLKDLPEKLEQELIVILEEDEQKRVESAYQDFNEEVQRAILSGAETFSDPAIATIHREMGEAKIGTATEIISDLLGLGTSEESCGKLVVFCYHLSVFDALLHKLNEMDLRPAGVSGRTSDRVRAEEIKRFQTDKNCKVFLGTFAAAEGITLTAASTCLFVEMSWTLSQNEQAQDRLHRIGQKNTVYIKYLLLENSLDMTVYNCYKRKGRDKKKLLGEAA